MRVFPEIDPPMTAPRCLTACLTWMAAASLSLLVACSSTGRPVSVYQREAFADTEAYARLFDAPPATTCEAARRALLSQGYLIDKLGRESLSATKSFQPDGEVHMQITVHVVCLPETQDRRSATAFVSAIQDRYALKKSSTAASVGLNALGSLSIPLGASGDALVKVGSETVPPGAFYDRFFVLMNRFIGDVPDDAAPKASSGPASAPAAGPR